MPGERVIYKKRAGAFFGTPLIAYLNEMGIDSLIMVGESTSGCLRASVIEGCVASTCSIRARFDGLSSA